MQRHRRNRSALSKPRRVSSKPLTISPVRRINSRISINNSQLPEFLQVSSNEINRLLTKDFMDVKIKIPSKTHLKQIKSVFKVK